MSTRELLEQMKAPIADQSTPEISDEENENSVRFTDKARLTIPSRKNQNRFRWSTDKIDALFECLKNIKTCYEFKGLDFESDLDKLYTEVRSLMAEKYDRNDFGPVITTEIGEDLSTEELAKQKAAVAEEKKLIKIGYQRIKQKIKDLRQDYSNAVTVGRRSGSGKLVEDNWEILKNIWGGSPAAINLRNARCFLQNQLSDKKDNESGNMNGENVRGDESQQLDGKIEESIAKKSSVGLAHPSL